MERGLKCCPSDFYNKCANAFSKCRDCVAGYGRKGSRLWYESREEGDDTKHPWESQGRVRKLEQKKKIISESKRVEQKQRDEIVKATLKSGSLLGDGDAKLLKGAFRLETKNRGVRKSWNLTVEEYQKGKRQGVDIFGITIKEPSTKKEKTLYLVDEHILGIILASVQSDLEKH